MVLVLLIVHVLLIFIFFRITLTPDYPGSRLMVSVHPPPLTPPTRGGGKTFPPPRWGRLGGGAELLRLMKHYLDSMKKTVRNRRYVKLRGWKDRKLGMSEFCNFSTSHFPNFKLGCLWQRLLGSPLERGAGGVLRQNYTPLYPLFLEGNYKILKFLNIKLGLWQLHES